MMTDSQRMRAIVKQVREEVQTITQPLRDDIEAVKQWQANHDKQESVLKRIVIRLAKSLLAMVGYKDDE